MTNLLTLLIHHIFSLCIWLGNPALYQSSHFIHCVFPSLHSFIFHNLRARLANGLSFLRCESPCQPHGQLSLSFFWPTRFMMTQGHVITPAFTIMEVTYSSQHSNYSVGRMHGHCPIRTGVYKTQGKSDHCTSAVYYLACMFHPT